MTGPKELWVTTIVIWTDYNPRGLEIIDLAREATPGDAYCSSQHVTRVTDPLTFPGTEFFNRMPDEEDWLDQPETVE